MLNNIYGFGTHRLKGEECFNAVSYALKIGYNLIDTAEKYNNSEAIGLAIHDSGVKREDIMIIHKLTDVDEFPRTRFATFQKVEGYLNELDTPYIDILLMHGPSPRYHPNPFVYREGNIRVWEAMHLLKNLGKIKAIGVSNFHKDQIMYLIEETGHIPDYVEVEFNIKNFREMFPLVTWCQKMGIKVIAYSPIVAGDLELIEKNSFYQDKKIEWPGLTPAEFALRFCLNYDTIPIPRSSRPENIKANLEALKKGFI